MQHAQVYFVAISVFCILVVQDCVAQSWPRGAPILGQTQFILKPLHILLKCFKVVLL